MINTKRSEQNPHLLALISNKVNNIFGDELEDWEIDELIDEDMSAHLRLKRSPEEEVARKKDETWEEDTTFRADISASLYLLDDNTTIHVTLMFAGSDVVHIMNNYHGLLTPEDIRQKAEEKLDGLMERIGKIRFGV